MRLIKSFLFWMVFGCPVISFAQANILIGQTHVTVDTVYTGLDIPWEIIYGSDGYIWVTERKGIVSQIDPVNKTKKVILDITSTVIQNGESGLLGMALHPNFDSNPEVFLVYTYGSLSNMKERVVKYDFNGVKLHNEQILLDNIKAYSNHDGSRLAILADHSLLISTGDASTSTLAQNMSSLNGKFLRINLDGTIPSNNPFDGSAVYSLGHRNAQGLVIGKNGKIYVSEHGTNANDEFQVLEAGRNYGWPSVEGFCDTEEELAFCLEHNVKEPIYIWSPTVAPSDMIYYENPSFPEFNDRVLMTTLKGKRIIALKLNNDGTAVTNEDHYLTDVFGRLRDIAVGPNKEIYLATNGQTTSNTNPGTHSILVLKVSEDSGVNEEHIDTHIRLYVDTNADKLEVRIPESNLGDDFGIYDVAGNTIYLSSIKDLSFSIDLKGVKNGVYIVVVSAKNGERFTQTIFKE